MYNTNYVLHAKYWKLQLLRPKMCLGSFRIECTRIQNSLTRQIDSLTRNFSKGD